MGQSNGQVSQLMRPTSCATTVRATARESGACYIKRRHELFLYAEAQVTVFNNRSHLAAAVAAAADTVATGRNPLGRNPLGHNPLGCIRRLAAAAAAVAAAAAAAADTAAFGRSLLVLLVLLVLRQYQQTTP